MPANVENNCNDDNRILLLKVLLLRDFYSRQLAGYLIQTHILTAGARLSLALDILEIPSRSITALRPDGYFNSCGFHNSWFGVAHPHLRMLDSRWSSMRTLRGQPFETSLSGNYPFVVDFGDMLLLTALTPKGKMDSRSLPCC